jgi:hypothetical protein
LCRLASARAPGYVFALGMKVRVGGHLDLPTDSVPEIAVIAWYFPLYPNV